MEAQGQLSQGLVEEVRSQLKEGPEQEQVVGPLVQYLLTKGYKLEQIRFGKREWRVPKSPSEAHKREKGRSYEGFPVDIAIFDTSTEDPSKRRGQGVREQPGREYLHLRGWG